MANRLNPNDDLAVIRSITSQDGRSTLVMQGDGNLVLYRAGGKARWATGTDGKVVAQAVMQGDGNFVMYGPGGTYIWDTATNGHPGAYLVLQDDGNVVIYDPNGTPLWATNTNIILQAVSGFLPSTSGFHFDNSFLQVPLMTINVLGRQIPIGDASKGLCGGMVFATRDYFEAGISIPPDTTSPSSGPLFDYFVRRLFDSFNLLLPPPPPPAPPIPGTFLTPTPPWGPGPLTYMHLMNPALPDHETWLSKVGLSYRGRAWIMIQDEWPKIKADIDSGHLSPVALVRVKSLDPTTMGDNHQVLVYGYELDGTDLTMRLYDPNSRNDDTLTMSLSLAQPDHTTSVTTSVGSTVWCFFRPDYTFSFPNVAFQAVINRGSGLSLDVARHAIRDNGAKVQQWDYAGTPNQQWAFVDAGGGWFWLRNRESGKALDVARHAIRDNGAVVQQWDYAGTPNQQWQQVDLGGGWFWLRNRESGKALDVHANDLAKNGAKVQQWDYAGTPNQQWQRR